MIDVEIERVTLNTERLLLRQFRLEDIDDIVKMGGFPTWDLSGPNPYTRQHAEEFLANTVLTPWNSMASFAAVLDNKVIGIINFKINRENETSTIGYSIGEEHWAKGLASEAAQTVLIWAFKDLKLEKVSATADVRNKRSISVMRKLGMTREALFRNDRVIRGVRTGMVWYGILRQEWTKVQDQRRL